MATNLNVPTNGLSLNKDVFTMFLASDTSSVLLHPMCLLKFLLEILCVFLKSICYFYFGHFITNN